MNLLRNKIVDFTTPITEANVVRFSAAPRLSTTPPAADTPNRPLADLSLQLHLAGEPVPLTSPEKRHHEREAHAPRETVDLLTNGRQRIADAHARKLAHAARTSGDRDVQFTRAEHDQHAAWRALLNQADMRFGRKDVDRALREIGMSRW